MNPIENEILGPRTSFVVPSPHGESGLPRDLEGQLRCPRWPLGESPDRPQRAPRPSPGVQPPVARRARNYEGSPIIKSPRRS